MKGRILLRILTSEPLNYRIIRTKGSHMTLQSKTYPPITFSIHSGKEASSNYVKNLLTKDVGLEEEVAWLIIKLH